MSNWTHVAAVARINSFGTDIDATKIFGNTCLHTDNEEIWWDQEYNPENYLPMGSEGSLEMSVWKNPDKSCMAAATVTIFGDLRDHDNPNEIIDWFKGKLKNVMVRQATITVENERNGTVNWTYGE